jgi:hypothetical protein
MKLTLQNSANGLVAVLIVAFGSLGISGGPVYPVGTNVVGTYGGILMPGCAGCTVNSDVFPPQTILVPVKCNKLDEFLSKNSGYTSCSDVPQGCSLNSLGIFSITVPDTGDSSGTFVMFSQGRVFNGTIQGTADPGKQKMSAILHATFDFTLVDTDETVTAEANGALNAKITQSSSKGIRLAGTSSLDVTAGTVNPDLTANVNCHMALSVSGFKQ